MTPCLLLLALGLTAPAQGDAAEVVFADFEGEGYGPGWRTTGAAFGTGPARGTLPGQMPVSGFRGRGLVNSFRGGDAATGTLTSPEFTIGRRYVRFLIGGGGFPGKTCVNLLVGGKVVRTATGPNTEPGGSERLEPAGWDVGEFMGKTARLQVVDDATGGWGHINLDHVVFTDSRPPLPADLTREVIAGARYLFFPIKNGAPRRKVTVSVGGKAERWFDVELADAEPDWWAPLDVSAWKGKTLTVRADRLPAGSKALARIEQGDEPKDAANLYREPLRPQLHFSARRGWLNDPNGLVYFDGVYHLFFQHNPYGREWGNMHWGHAVSTDLVRWEERGIALYPDAMGPVFSGSAVIDWHNTSGLGEGGKPPLVLAYTAAGSPTVQCLAYSNDGGKSFTRYAGNPVVKQITPGNRDPKVFWHAPTRRWVMTLYVELNKKHTIHVLTSPDLKGWKVRSQVEGFFECPDLFELAVDGDPARKKWVLTAASSEYMMGTFDGATFTPETPRLPGHRGKGFYAAQTFSDLPEKDGRRVQVGWLQAPSPGMPFNQAMSVPLELKLVGTPDGPRLAWKPVRELDVLRGKKTEAGPLTLKPGDPNPVPAAAGELLDVVALLEPEKAAEVTFLVRGVPVVYDAAKQELRVNGHRAAAPLRQGKLDLRILTDRTAFEVFASGGLTYVPMPVIARAGDRSVGVSVRGGAVRFSSLQVHELRPIWEAEKARAR